MVIVDCSSNVVFEETDNGVKMYVNITHPHKTADMINVHGVKKPYPLRMCNSIEFSEGGNDYEVIKSFFK
jgi:hypothetical protein